MPDPDPSRMRPGLLARLEEASRQERTGWLLGVTLTALVAGAAAWLLTPGSVAQRFPGDDALGTPAVGSFKAARDYEIPDLEATERLRAEAAAEAPEVFDLDEGAAEEAVTRARAAFQAGREALGDPRRTEPGRKPPRQGPVPPGARAAFEARLGTPLRDDDLAALVEARFSDAVEQRVAALMAHGLSGRVVDDRDRLVSQAERGILVRSLREGVPQGERLVRDFALFRDARAAREDVRREAPTLPAAWPPALREAAVRMAAGLVRPTVSFNLAETARRQRDAADRVKPVLLTVRRGEKIVGDGERIERRHLVVFRGIQAQTRDRDLLGVRAGGALLVTLLVLLLWRHARMGGLGFRPSRRDAVLLAALFLGTMGLAAAGMAAGDLLHDRFPRQSPEAFYHLIPFAAGAMLARALLSAEVALRFAVASGVAVGLLAGHSLFFAVHAVLTAVAASSLSPRGRDRVGVIEAGLGVGAIAALLALAAQLFTGRSLADAAGPAGLAFLGNAALLPALVGALLPLAERLLGYTTDARLQELANLNHPALKDLIVQAPGTYHHSVVMGAMVEAAAEKVGAHPLLAKVCAYYHDLGKIRNPLYFHENQRSDNRHDSLAPSMSALIVKRHVQDGLELAARWKLPAPVADAIAQHHGTRFVSYFWAKAQRAAEEGTGPWADPSAADEALFRYAGPRPRSREAALVMLGDVIEASARNLAEPAPERIAQLAQKRLDELVAEGQLDECPLTLRELRAAAAEMGRALDAVYRARPDDSRPGGESRERQGLHLVAKR